MAKTLDEKLLFPAYDCAPGNVGWRGFSRNLLAHGGKDADDEGWSYADVYMGTDDDGVNGTAIPGANNAANNTARKLRRKRLKGAQAFIVRHISHTLVIEQMTEPPCLGNGYECYEMLRRRCEQAPDTSDSNETKAEWQSITIANDIGVNENTITELQTLLERKNALIPVAHTRFTDDQIAVKILECVRDASSLFAVDAADEINAVEGVPGQPGVRLYQLAAPILVPAVAGAPAVIAAMGVAAAPPVIPAPAVMGPRPRNLAGLVDAYGRKWRQLVRSKALNPSKPLKAAPPGRMLKVVEQARMLRVGTSVDQGQPASEGTMHERAAPAPRAVSPSQTLGAVTETGFTLQRGTVTTSDWEVLPKDGLDIELAALCDEGDAIPVGFWANQAGEREWRIEVSYDADGVPSIEVICDKCRGLGHRRRECPSADKYRTLAYAIAMLEAAKARAEGRAEERGDAKFGRRPPPRGMREPFNKAMPRRFQPSRGQPSNPFRRGIHPE